MLKAPFRLEHLSASHRTADFSCGSGPGADAIDTFFHQQALAEQEAGLSSVTVAVDANAGEIIVGFFTLSPTSIRIDVRVLDALGLATIPYPSIGGYLLGRFGVSIAYQKQGIGRALVAAALVQAQQSRSRTGGVFLAVDPKGEGLVQWYQKRGYIRLGAASRRVVRRL